MQTDKSLFIILLCVASVCLAQPDKLKPELFTNYLGATLPANGRIPAKTCGAIINQADRIVMADELQILAKDELRAASLNLRSCATSPELTRLDRDLAVGLYGEVVSEQERRERAAK